MRTNNSASIVERMVIPHTAFAEARRRIEQCFAFSAAKAEGEGLAIVGESGTGKTSVLKSFQANHMPRRGGDGMESPILYASVPPMPTVKSLAGVMLAALNAPDCERGTENEKSKRLRVLMQETGTRMVMIDEFQHFYDRGKRQIMLHVADWLKVLIDETRATLVVAGLPSCRVVINENEQLARRFMASIQLPRFSWANPRERGEFISILEEYHNQIAKDFEVPALHSDEMAFRLFLATGGLMGYLSKLLRTTLRDAVDGKRTSITLEDLSIAHARAMWFDPTVEEQLRPFEHGFRPEATVELLDRGGRVGTITEPPQRPARQRQSAEAGIDQRCAGGRMKTPLLVRHPAPFSTESLLGYVLRLSEKNGYFSPTAVCRLAGIKLNDLGAIGVKPERLASIASCADAEVNRISFAVSANGRRSSQLLGHRLVPAELSLANPKLCPECVAEKGFIEAHWHLDLMVACPVHLCLATSECSMCKERLRWLRPGLLECNCGGILQISDTPKLGRSQAALLDIVRRKLMGYPATAANPLALPQEPLMAMDLRSMLAVIRVIAKHRLMADRYTSLPNAQQIILAASRVLMDWPKNFYTLLKDIRHNASGGRCGGVGKQYGEIHRDLFRNRAITPSACTDFFRVAFLDFAIDICGPDVVYDDSGEETIDNDIEPFLTQAEFAERAHLHQKTAIRLLKTLKLSSELVESGPKSVTSPYEKQTEHLRRNRNRGKILDMVRQGSRRGRLHLVDLGIVEGSGAAFRREYTLLTAIAGAKEIGTVELMRRCSERDIRILLVPVARQGLRPIIRASDRERLGACPNEDKDTQVTASTANGPTGVRR